MSLCFVRESWLMGGFFCQTAQLWALQNRRDDFRGISLPNYYYLVFFFLYIEKSFFSEVTLTGSSLLHFLPDGWCLTFLSCVGRSCWRWRFSKCWRCHVTALNKHSLLGTITLSLPALQCSPLWVAPLSLKRRVAHAAFASVMTQ